MGRRLRPSTFLLSGLLLLMSAAGVGCEANSAADGAESGGGTVTVFAASSLTDAFTEIGRRFEAEHEGVEVEFNFGSSSALATQIEEGGPADVFASANQEQMRRLEEGGLLGGEPVIFARNTPVIVVPEENPGAIEGPDDLAQPGLRLVLAAEDVPIGGYAREVIANLASRDGYPENYAEAVLANLVSGEANVRAVLSKIELGEGDAAIVYRTDAAVAEGVTVIEIPEDANIVAAYPMALVGDDQSPNAAQGFIGFVLSDEGRRVLADFGFSLP